MRNLLAFFAALVLTVAGLGWYLGWFQVTTAPGKDGHTKVEMDFNTVKATEDGAKFTSKVSEWTNELAEKARKEQQQGKADADKSAAPKSQPPKANGSD